MAYGSQVSTENNGLEFEDPVRDKCKKYCLGSISDVVREIWWSINNSHYCTNALEGMLSSSFIECWEMI